MVKRDFYKLFSVAVIFGITLFNQLYAGGPPGGGGPGMGGAPCWPPSACIPINDGLYILLAAGLIYGLVKFKKINALEKIN